MIVQPTPPNTECNIKRQWEPQNVGNMSAPQYLGTTEPKELGTHRALHLGPARSTKHGARSAEHDSFPLFQPAELTKDGDSAQLAQCLNPASGGHRGTRVMSVLV